MIGGLLFGAYSVTPGLREGSAARALDAASGSGSYISTNIDGISNSNSTSTSHITSNSTSTSHITSPSTGGRVGVCVVGEARTFKYKVVQDSLKSFLSLYSDVKVEFELYRQGSSSCAGFKSMSDPSLCLVNTHESDSVHGDETCANEVGEGGPLISLPRLCHAVDGLLDAQHRVGAGGVS